MSADPRSSVDPSKRSIGASSRRGAYVHLIVIVAIVATWIAVATPAIDRPYSLDYDEGVFLCSASAAQDGAALYTDIYTAQPPLFVALLRQAFTWLGESVGSARVVSVATAVAALAATGVIAWRIAGPSAAVVACLALALTFPFWRQARTAQPNMAALGLASLALAFVVQPSRRRAWSLPATGAALAAGLLCKPLVAPYAFPVLALIWRPFLDGTIDGHVGALFGRRAAPGLVRRLLLVAAGSLVLTPLIWSQDLAALWRQTVTFHVEARHVAPFEPHVNLAIVVGMLRAEAGLVLAAILGLRLLFRTRSDTGQWLVVWLLSCVAALVLHRPLFPHHVVILMPPLAVAAGCAIDWSREIASPGRRAWVWAAVCVLLMFRPVPTGPLTTMWFGQVLSHPGRDVRALDETFADERASQNVMSSLARPGDEIVTDDPMQPFRAGLRQSPSSCDTSRVRIASGFLTLSEAQTMTAEARIVLLWSGRLEEIPGFRAWLAEHYRLAHTFRNKAGFRRELYVTQE